MLMVDKKTRLVVKVYGFVCDDGIIKAVTYQDDPLLKLRKFVDRKCNTQRHSSLVIASFKEILTRSMTES